MSNNYENDHKRFESEVLDVIINTNSDNINVISELQFKKYILPIISQDVDSEDVDIKDWRLIAGNDMMPIKVIDTANGNKDLFTIPSIVGTLDTEINSDPNKSISNIVAEHKSRERISSVVAQQYLKDNLEANYTNRHPDVPAAAYERIEQWNYIFSRYGLIDKMIHLEGPGNNSISTPVEEEFTQEDF